MTLVTHDLGEAGLRWVRQQLGDAFLKMGRYLERLPVESGRAWTRLPAHISAEEAARRLPSGHLSPWPKLGDWLWSNSIVAQYLARHPERLAVGPSPALLTWPVLAEILIPYVHSSGEVYPYLAGDSHPSEALLNELKDFACWYPYVAVLTSLPDGHPALVNKAEVGEDLLELLAARTELLVVGAYDEETDVIWERPAAQRPTLRP